MRACAVVIVVLRYGWATQLCLIQEIAKLLYSRPIQVTLLDDTAPFWQIPSMDLDIDVCLSIPRISTTTRYNVAQCYYLLQLYTMNARFFLVFRVIRGSGSTGSIGMEFW